MASAAARHVHLLPNETSLLSVLPGAGLCITIAAAAYLLEAAERILLGRAWLEALVMAVLLGVAVRSLWHPGNRYHAGIAFSAKYLLEIAVVLLGLSVKASTILAAGPGLLLGIAGVVGLAILLSFGISRCMRLPVRMALLIACGNSICGNSAIAAVAPVIGADSDDVAASIAFTAILGVAVVLLMPIIGSAIDLHPISYGAFAGLTVYAVPQVLAAAAPFGPSAVHMGTLVKLVRVLMLGPVCLVLSMVAPKLPVEAIPADEYVAGGDALRPKISLAHLVPWFIIGFLLMLACRSLGLVPEAIVVPSGRLATCLTVISMAALGLGVDLRAITAVGGRVTASAILSLAALSAISLFLLWALHFQ
ncbi:YeiH family protein [Sphingomonas sp.]|uniref:YeiH family protein n=1 Tax=Sphingomonas sp. TaxID=28214 RepID=UPI003B3B410B